MTNPNFEKIADLQKNSAEAFAKVAISAVDSAEKIIQLNLAKGRALVAVTGESAKETMQAKNPTEVAQKSSEKFQSQLNDSISYSHELYNTCVSMQKELTNAFQAQIKMVTDVLSSTVDQKKFLGADTFSSSIKSMIDAGNKALENVNTAAKQFSELAESNFKAVARIGSDSSEKKAPAAPTSKKAAVTASTTA